MKVQLIVVRGKPEGKVIPLAGPKFKIGRGQTCHLRPNSELVSREHAEFTIERNAVTVRDLESRNGTLVNGKALTAEPCKLKHRDLVQVGPLTFAVSILDVPAPAVKPAPPTPPALTKKSSPNEIAAEEISSWLLGDPANLGAGEETKVYRGETVTISAFKDVAGATLAQTQLVKPASSDDAEYERETEAEGDNDELRESAIEDDADVDSEAAESGVSLEDPFMDPSNPFYAAKKAQREQAKAAKGAPAAGATGKRPVKDTSVAAHEILRKLMERRRPPKR